MNTQRKNFVERAAFEKGYRVSQCGGFVTGGKRKLRGDDKGYLQFGVSINGSARPVPVHRLQAYQLFGDQIYQDGIHIRHLDGNHLNNSAANIKPGTASENMMDKSPEVRRRSASMANLKHDISAIRKFYSACKSYVKTMAEFGISSKGTLHSILTRELIV